MTEQTNNEIELVESKLENKHSKKPSTPPSSFFSKSTPSSTPPPLNISAHNSSEDEEENYDDDALILLPNPSIKTEEKVSNTFDQLSEKIRQHQLADKANILNILLEIEKIFTESSVEPTHDSDDPKVILCNKLLNQALDQLQAALQSPQDTNSAKISYFIARHIFHIMGPHADLLPENTIKRIPWLPNLLTDEEQTRFEIFRTKAELDLSGSIPDPTILHRGNLADIIPHPLFDAHYKDSTEVKKDYRAAMLLEGFSSNLPGTEKWDFLGDQIWYEGIRGRHRPNEGVLKRMVQLHIVFRALDSSKPFNNEDKNKLLGVLSSTYVEGIKPYLQANQAKRVERDLDALRGEPQNSSCCIIT